MESVNANVDVKLFNSSLDGDLEGVVAALAQGGRVAVRNLEGGTPLILAAQNGHTDIRAPEVPFLAAPKWLKLAKMTRF